MRITAQDRVGGKLHPHRSYQTNNDRGEWDEPGAEPHTAHDTQQAHAMRPSSKHRMRTGNPELGEGLSGEPEAWLPVSSASRGGARGDWLNEACSDGLGGAGGDWRDAPVGGTGARRLAGCGAAR